MVHSERFESQPVAQQGLEFVPGRVFYGGYHPDGVDDPPGMRFGISKPSWLERGLLKRIANEGMRFAQLGVRGRESNPHESKPTGF